jgi:transposase-like protein
VDLLRRSDKTATQVARELGIGQTTLSRWTLQAAKMPLGSNGFMATADPDTAPYQRGENQEDVRVGRKRVGTRRSKAGKASMPKRIMP